MRDKASDAELKKVIADFLEMGHVDNIVEMFKRGVSSDPRVAELLNDEWFSVRLGLSVPFQELKRHCPDDFEGTVSSLCWVLDSSPGYVLGDAINILGIIGTSAALGCVEKALDDDSPQVREVAMDVLEEYS